MSEEGENLDGGDTITLSLSPEAALALVDQIMSQYNASPISTVTVILNGGFSEGDAKAFDA